jgi:class 3 adenylate cyclase/tetratricopeptide (TPR) repeat protein
LRRTRAACIIARVICADCGHGLPAGAKFCPECGTRVADAPADDGERRHATIVFSDLSGYTALNERLDPEEVEAIMGRVKREATRIVESHGGIVNQFIGDEVVALFGIPVARREDPVRAVRAALELHAAVRAISTEVAPRIGRALTMHSGINTGLIVTRRSDSRDGRFGLTGDAVNTGARLLGLADADEVVVGPDTWKQVAAHFSAEVGTPMEVRGKERPLTPYRIRGELVASGVPHRPIVGREPEVARFDALAEACAERARGGVMIVRGQPGIGKTRLLAEFVDIARGRGIACHAALVLDFSAGRGGDAIRHLVRSLLGLAPGADEEARRLALETALHNGLLPAGLELSLGDLLDVAPRQALRALDAAMTAAARDRGTVDALVALARDGAGRGPLLLVVEDVHWADAWTLERVAALGDTSAHAPLLLVVTTRVDGDPTRAGWRASPSGAGIIDIDLHPLSVDDAQDLASRFPGLPVGQAREMIERAEGNPLFLEQLLLNAGESGAGNLPGSIQSLVLARMDRLPAIDKQAFQAASVLGQRFALDALRHLLQREDCDCGVLVEHQLVRPSGPDWLFSHALIRDGAYESMLKSRRRQLHVRAAEWFSGREPGLCAEHFERAEDPRAASACLAACEEEARRYHYDRALTFAERGIRLAAGAAERYALTIMRARILLEAGRAHDAIAVAREALQHAGDAGQRAEAMTVQASGMRIVDQVQDALDVLAQAEPLARESGSALLLARLHHLRGGFYFGLGRSEECLREHEASLAQARAAGSLEAEANALSGLGDANYVRGRMRTAHERFRACVDLAQRNGFGRIEVANKHMAAWTLHYLGRLVPALEVSRDAVDMAARVSHPRTEAMARQTLAYVQGWLMGEVREARAELEKAMQLVRALGARRFEAQNLVFQAQLLLREGERDRAGVVARDALAFCRTHAMSFIGPMALAVAAQSADDADERRRLLAEGEALLALGSISHNYFDFYACAIDDALGCGDWGEAERYCDAFARYVSDEPVPWSDMVVARGRALARAGRGERDAALLAQIERLRAEAAAARFDVHVPALDAAIMRFREE